MLHLDLYEWLARLADQEQYIRIRAHVVWTLELVRKVRRVDSPISKAVDFLFDSTIGGYITQFDVDTVQSYSQA